MNYDSRNNALVRVYGSECIDRKMPGYCPESGFTEKTRSHGKVVVILEKAKEHLLEKSGIDSVIRELTFAIFSFGIFIYMQSSGRLAALAGFGALVGALLIFATLCNLFRASLKSLSPGIICFAIGLFLLNTHLHESCFSFITDGHLNYVVGLGCFFISISLINSGK